MARFFELAVEALPDTPFLLQRVAWLLAKSPDEKVRNGARAVELAERVVQFTRGEDPAALDALAAAFPPRDRRETPRTSKCCSSGLRCIVPDRNCAITRGV